MNKNLATVMTMGLMMAIEPPPVEKLCKAQKERDPFAKEKRKRDKIARNSRKINGKR